MKLIRITQNVSIPSMPAFRVGQQVRVADHIADLLVERGHAKLEKGESEHTIKEKKKVESKEEVKEVSTRKDPIIKKS